MTVDSPWGERSVLVTMPRRQDHMDAPGPHERYPVLIALHGRGEAADQARAHLAWSRLYGLAEGFGALMRGNVQAGDYRRLVRIAHLDFVNESLRRQRFRGVMVVTTHMPDFAREEVGSAAIHEYGDWCAGPLLAAVRERFEGAARTREGTGIDGVSLGGRVALEIGFTHAEAFGAVGAIQPAVSRHSDPLAALALLGGRQAPQRIRVLSSTDDHFLAGARRLSQGLNTRRVTHTLSILPGPHGYEFNRGPGVIELLLFHDRALLHEAR